MDKIDTLIHEIRLQYRIEQVDEILASMTYEEHEELHDKLSVLEDTFKELEDTAQQDHTSP